MLTIFSAQKLLYSSKQSKSHENVRVSFTIFTESMTLDCTYSRCRIAALASLRLRCTEDLREQVSCAIRFVWCWITAISIAGSFSQLSPVQVIDAGRLASYRSRRITRSWRHLKTYNCGVSSSAASVTTAAAAAAAAAKA